MNNELMKGLTDHLRNIAIPEDGYDSGFMEEDIITDYFDLEWRDYAGIANILEITEDESSLLFDYDHTARAIVSEEFRKGGMPTSKMEILWEADDWTLGGPHEEVLSTIGNVMWDYPDRLADIIERFMNGEKILDAYVDVVEQYNGDLGVDFAQVMKENGLETHASSKLGDQGWHPYDDIIHHFANMEKENGNKKISFNDFRTEVASLFNVPNDRLIPEMAKVFRTSEQKTRSILDAETIATGLVNLGLEWNGKTSQEIHELRDDPEKSKIIAKSDSDMIKVMDTVKYDDICNVISMYLDTDNAMDSWGSAILKNFQKAPSQSISDASKSSDASDAPSTVTKKVKCNENMKNLIKHLEENGESIDGCEFEEFAFEWFDTTSINEIASILEIDIKDAMLLFAIYDHNNVFWPWCEVGIIPSCMEALHRGFVGEHGVPEETFRKWLNNSILEQDEEEIYSAVWHSINGSNLLEVLKTYLETGELTWHHEYMNAGEFYSEEFFRDSIEYHNKSLNAEW